MNKIIRPKFIIGDIVKKDNGDEHLITGVCIKEQKYSIDGDNKMIEWFFDFSEQDEYVLVNHKSIRIGNVLYE